MKTSLHIVGLNQKPHGPEMTLWNAPTGTPIYVTELHFGSEEPYCAGWGEITDDARIVWYGSTVDSLDNIDLKASKCLTLGPKESLVLTHLE